MLARDLATPCPSVDPTTSVLAAARLLASENLPGLVVLDEGQPPTILPGTDVVRMAVPGYCLADPTLARVVDEAAADVFLQHLSGRTVGELLPDQHHVTTVDGDATALEVAALMARASSPLVAVVDEGGAFVGVVTLDGLLDRVLAS